MRTSKTDKTYKLIRMCGALAAWANSALYAQISYDHGGVLRFSLQAKKKKENSE